MKSIPLISGKIALVDDDDEHIVSKYRWSETKSAGTSYAISTKSLINEEHTPNSMHRIIMNPPKGLVVDHIDGNGLNNQKSNLRVVTQKENTNNKHTKEIPNTKTCRFMSCGVCSCVSHELCPKKRLPKIITMFCYRVPNESIKMVRGVQ